MTFEEIEQLIRRHLRAGATVVVVLVAPSLGTDGAAPGEPGIVVIQPGSASATSLPAGTPEPDAGTGGPSADGTPAPAPGPDDTGARGTSTQDTSSTPDSEEPDTGNPSTENRSTENRDTENRDTGARDTPVPDASTRSRSPQAPTGTRSTTSPSTTRTTAPDPDRTGADGTDPGRADDEPAPRTTPTGEPDDSEATTGDRAGRDDTDADADRTGGGTGAGATAAERHGWGEPERVDDFSGGLEQWSVYDGPGHAGQGRRSPSAVTVQGGVLRITGDASGTTAGMAWNPGRRYGRWEGRVRAPVGDPSYHALLLLWPDAEDFPRGGEIDFMETSDPARQRTEIFIHHGPQNDQVSGQVAVDSNDWHTWAVEWTPDGITAYVDGREWYRTTDTSVLPPGPMHLCIQLDWFPDGGTPRETVMEVDWVKQYALDGASGGERGSGSGDGDGAGDGGAAPEAVLRRMVSWR